MLSRTLICFGIFLAMISGTSFSTPADSHLDCSSPPGREVCVAIRRVEINVQPCEGTGCDFYYLIRLMDRATDLFIQSLSTTASDQAGDFAFSAASALCHTAFTGERDVIRRLTASANRFVRAMQEIQIQAGLTDTMVCEFEIDDRSTSAFRSIDAKRN